MIALSSASRIARAGAVVVLAAGLASSAAGARALAGVAGPAGGWGKAERVPGSGTGVLNSGITSVSCASAGNCSAGGGSPTARSQAFVVSQVNGIWGQAEVVPGLAALNAGGQAQITSLSCASAGNCSAGGDYSDASRRSHAFVVSQVHGIWGQAEAVPGLAALNGGDQAQITSVSCASAGNCSAGGYYFQSASGLTSQAFVVSQVNGTWRKAEAVPGLAKLNVNGASVGAVSCASAGNCSAGGFYTDAGFANDSFVVSQVHGTWGQAESLPRANLSQDDLGDSVDTLSCPSAGNCTVGGDYVDSNTNVYVYVDSEVDGTWGQAEQVPGTAAVSGGDLAGISVSCASAGNCSAGGSYTGSDGHQQAFVDSQVGGTWGQAREVPGLPRLNTGRDSAIGALSCPSAGDCSAGGSYTDSSGHFQAFVVSRVHGIWGTAEEVPGTAALNVGGFARIASVSCASAGHCSAGGSYTDSSGHSQAFVVSRT